MLAPYKQVPAEGSQQWMIWKGPGKSGNLEKENFGDWSSINGGGEEGVAHSPTSSSPRVGVKEVVGAGRLNSYHFLAPGPGKGGACLTREFQLFQNYPLWRNYQEEEGGAGGLLFESYEDVKAFKND